MVEATRLWLLSASFKCPAATAARQPNITWLVTQFCFRLAAQSSRYKTTLSLIKVYFYLWQNWQNFTCCLYSLLVFWVLLLSIRMVTFLSQPFRIFSLCLSFTPTFVAPKAYTQMVLVFLPQMSYHYLTFLTKNALRKIKFIKSIYLFNCSLDCLFICPIAISLIKKKL